jgi:hypothetical protein
MLEYLGNLDDTSGSETVQKALENVQTTAFSHLICPYSRPLYPPLKQGHVLF